MKTFQEFLNEKYLDEGALRALGMGTAAAVAGELASKFGPGAALPPGAGAALAAAWYLASGEAKKDWNHGKKKEKASKDPLRAEWPVVPYKPKFA